MQASPIQIYLLVSYNDKEIKRRMLQMSQIENIRNLRLEGSTVAEIRKITNLDRKTIDKYLTQTDFSVTVDDKATTPAQSKLDPCKPIIDKLLENERDYFHKQRFTAIRMHEYLSVDLKHTELKNSYHLVRKYMKSYRNGLRREYDGPGSMKLVWHPGEAQGDFGEADFYEPDGTLGRKKYLVLSFPNSNKAVFEILPGENGECVCQGLFDFFMFLGFVPRVIVFDNATGIAKRICNIVQQSELFTRFRLHYRFIARFANVRSGWEKGNVENKVGVLRRNLLAPPLQISYPIQAFNKEVLMPDSFAFRAEEPHYEKGISGNELYKLDEENMIPLPPTPFEVARIVTGKANKTGTVMIDNVHSYVLGSGHSSEDVLVAKGAWDLHIYTRDGRLIKGFPREYGSMPTQTYDIEAILSSLIHKPNAWLNSHVREAMPHGGFRDHIDASEPKTKRNALYMLNECTDRFGFGNASIAANQLCKDGKVPKQEDIFALCNRMVSFPLELSENATNVSLSMFDALLEKRSMKGAV